MEDDSLPEYMLHPDAIKQHFERSTLTVGDATLYQCCNNMYTTVTGWKFGFKTYANCPKGFAFRHQGSHSVDPRTTKWLSADASGVSRGQANSKKNELINLNICTHAVRVRWYFARMEKLCVNLLKIVV